MLGQVISAQKNNGTVLEDREWRVGSILDGILRKDLSEEVILELRAE